MIGTVLGHYKILRLVGKGGMGEVYAAEDQTLGRTVAIKVLPAGIHAQPAELERFSREAKTIASLNHRAIVTLYSFEESAGTHFITMELVEGAPLSARIPAAGLPFDDVLRMGIEMTDAVSAAHERGIVHRDLKPANVLVRPDGQIKILDFGLAKLRAQESAAADLPTQQLTGEGRIVGTVAYMSPEQAEGRAVDHRSDIFSLGVMLYEMATGQRPFQGDTSLSVLSAVLKDQPKLATDLNPRVPSAFARVLKICLHKDPERRYQSAKDLRNELQTLKEELDSGELMRPAAVAPVPAGPQPIRWPLVAASIGGLAVAVYALIQFWPGSGSSGVTPVSLQHTRLTSASGVEQDPALSPDGKWFLYVSNASGNLDIYLQSVGGQNPINLTKDSLAADREPAFSPDGERIAFWSAREAPAGIYVMGRTGETPRRITSSGRDPHWSPDGKHLVFATVSAEVPTSRGALSAIRRVSIETGEVTTLTEVDALNPSWSPNGKFIAFWGLGRTEGGTTFTSHRDLFVISADGGTPWQLTSDAHVDWAPVWSPDGAFIYFDSNRGGAMNLWRLPMDPESGRAAGDPQAVTTSASYVGRLRMAGAGIIFESREAVSNVYRASFDAARAVVGEVQPVTSGSRTFRFVDASPDGEYLVLGTSFLQQEDVFVSKSDGSELRQLTNDAFNDRWPTWAPDGKRIAFYSDRSGKYEIWITTTSGQLQQLTRASTYSLLYPRWSPSGRLMSASDISISRATMIFDPNRPWNEQTPDVLPAPAGPGSLFGPTATAPFSPDETQMAGMVGNVVTIYDIAKRTYREVPGARAGPVFAWLKDGRLLVGPPRLLRLIDPGTGRIQPVTLPSFGALTPAEFRLTRDERMVYFPLTTNESDIWMVTLR
jgi:Tol biopolymer transport system component